MTRTVISMFTTLGLAGVLIFSSCRPQQPEIVRIHDIHLSDIMVLTQQVQLNFTTSISNPYSIPIYIDRVETEVRLEGEYIGLISNTNRIDLAPGTISEVPLSHRIPLSGLSRIISKTNLTDSVRINLESTYHFDGKGISTRVKHSKEAYIHPFGTLSNWLETLIK